MLKQLRRYFSHRPDHNQPEQAQAEQHQSDSSHDQTPELSAETNSYHSGNQYDSENDYQVGNGKSTVGEVLFVEPVTSDPISAGMQPIIPNGNGNIAIEENSAIDGTRIQPLAGDELQRVTARKHFELGHYYREQGQFDAAVMQYRKTLILDPGLVEAYHHLAEALRESGNLAEAATYYRQAIALTEQQSSNGHSSNGRSSNGHSSNGHSSNGHSSNGQSYVTEQDPTFQTQPLEVQLTTVGQVEGKTGTTDVEVVLEAKESDLAQAEQCYAQQQWQETIAHCQAAVQVSPSAVVYRLMGSALQRLEQFEAAMDAYLEAIKLEPRSAEIHANLGSLYAQQNRWHDAVMYYQSAITLKPDFAGVYRNLARVWEQLDRSDSATECWIEAVKLEPEKVPVDQLFNVGNVLLEQNQIEAAISCYRRVVEADPEFVEAYQQLAEAYTQQQCWQEAVECYRQVQALSQPTSSMLMLQGSRVPSLLAKSGIENLPLVRGGRQDLDNLLVMLRQGWNTQTRFGEAEEQLEEAEDYFEQEQWDEAIAASSAALEQLEPEMVQAYRNLAQALYAKNDLDEAIRYYRRVVELEPEAAGNWVNLGSLYAQLQQWQGAIQCYQTALKLNPKLASAHWNLAKVWQRTGQAEQASDSMLVALSIEPDWASNQEHLQLCHTLLSQGKTDAAAICYRQVIGLDAGCAEAHVCLADLLVQAGQWQEAITHYQQAVKYEPTNARYYARLGFSLSQVQQIDGAIEAYGRVVALAPDQPEYFRTLAGWLEQQQVWDELIVCLQKLGALQPQDAELHHKLGDLLNQQQRWQEAVPAFQRAIELNPDFSWSHNNLGDALLHLEEWKAAAGEYRKAIELNPEFHWSHYNLGEALVKLEDWDGAIGAYRRALELEPSLPKVSQKIGDALFYRAKADLDIALGYYQQIILDNPNDEQVYHKALEIQPHNPQFYIGLSNTLMQKGKMHEATVFLQMVQQLELDPGAHLTDNSINSASVIDNIEKTVDHKPLIFHQEGNLVDQLKYLEEYSVISKELDSDFYYAQYPDIAEGKIDPVMHYITAGWKELRDPSPNFSTQYYLKYNPDIANGNLNPFYHFIVYGRSEGRRGCSFSSQIFKKSYLPKVSIIVPNYNHARYLPERLDSILSQTYQNYELIILDDCSKDESRSVIEKYHDSFPTKTKYVFNEENSGSVFKQWRKGLELSTGELVWICESDDSCEHDFLEKLIKYFADPSIMIAFGKIQFINENSVEFPGLDAYRESAFPCIWNDVQIATSGYWFKGAFGIRNVIANVGGCIFRNQDLPVKVWEAAQKYKVCADWFLYAVLAGGGRIAYDPQAKSYFRQHSLNTSVTNFASQEYYREHFRVAKFLRNHHGVDNNSLFVFYNLLAEHYKDSYKKNVSDGLIDLFDISALMREKKTTRHILIASLGFHLGGGELFPIHLANHLLSMGYLVSFAVLDHEQGNEDIRNLLDKRVSVYCKDLIKEIGIERFVKDANIDLIHSHNPGWEYLFSSSDLINIPYVVTHHGAYECSQIDENHLLRFLELVTHWVYISEKNLSVFNNFSLSPSSFTKLPNAVPVSQDAFPLTRSDLGISEDAFVFGIASRAIKTKGWEEAIKALLAVGEISNKEVFLLLCGEGEERERLSSTYRGAKNVKFLGYQKAIHGLYRLCNCSMLASRFPGESFPLTLIESIQTSTPVIATNVGEVKNIITCKAANSVVAGILVDLETDDDKFVDSLVAAMLKMLNPKNYLAYVNAAKQIQNEFQMDRVASQYASIYEQLLEV